MKRNRAEEHLLAGRRLEAEGLMKRAEREYRAAVERTPRNVVALNSLGALLAARGLMTEGLGAETRPWYPSLKLFRQDRPRDWTGVCERLSQALAQLLAARGG